MFLLVSVRHVGAHPDEFQHGVSIQSSINLGKTFLLVGFYLILITGVTKIVRYIEVPLH